MKQIFAKIGDKKCTIVIGANAIRHFSFNRLGASGFVVVADMRAKKHLASIFGLLVKKLGKNLIVIEIKNGERAKNIATVERICRIMARSNCDRDAVIISFGGGVVGDIAGFSASIYHRGIRYVHIPTTLLAQVDSSIGGKTGVNLPEGKNLMGSIYQPSAVIMDTSALKTLPKQEINNGLAEAIKYGVIGDKALFRFLERNALRRDAHFFQHIIVQSCIFKLSVVKKDERETNLRYILNYGHTMGHAIEAASQYRIPHGKAIAIGMIYEGYLAVVFGSFPYNDWVRQTNLLKRICAPSDVAVRPPSLIDFFRRDKKSTCGEPRFVFPSRIGSVARHRGLYLHAVPRDALYREFQVVNDMKI